MRNPDDPTASTDAGSDAAQERSFYGRWSRRKRQAREGIAPAEDPPPRAAEQAGSGTTPAAPRSTPEAEAGDPASDERALSDADMPPLDSLGEEDDYSGFMSPGVSETLRNQALRQLFRSSHFNVVDGLDDYADDFTRFEPLGDIITADMRHQMEVQAERAKREAEEKARALLADEEAGTDAAAVEAQEAADQEDGDAPGADEAQAAGAGDPASEEKSDDGSPEIADQDPENGGRHV